MNYIMLVAWELTCCFGMFIYGLFEAFYYFLVGLFFNQPSQKTLKGSNVVITGAAGGIGRSLVLKFYEEGCNVALLDVNKSEIDQIVGDMPCVKSNGCKAVAYACDLTDVLQVSRTFTEVRQTLGHIDILVNNAGIALGKTLIDESFKEVKRTMEVNCLAQFLTIKEVLPSMISYGRGHIVSIASILGLFGFGPNCTDYIASKFGVVGLMEALDYELHTKGIDNIGLTTVCPFMVQTPMFHGAVPSRFNALFPMLKPEYVAEAVIEAVMKRKRILVLPRRVQLFVILKWILPRSLCFRLLDLIEVDNSMSTFQGRNLST